MILNVGIGILVYVVKVVFGPVECRWTRLIYLTLFPSKGSKRFGQINVCFIKTDTLYIGGDLYKVYLL